MSGPPGQWTGEKGAPPEPQYPGPSPQYPGPSPPYQPPYPPAQNPGTQPYPVTQPYPAVPPASGTQPYPGAYGGTTQTTVVVQQVQMGFGFVPQPMTCHYCHASIVTAIHYEVGTFAWLAGGLLCIFGCLLCFWIPCVVNGAKDVIHTCPNCKQQLGRKTRM